MTDSQALEKECPECKGDGVAERIGGYERPCDACHGEGFVQRPQPSGDEVERVAEAIRGVLARIGFMDPEWGGTMDECRMVARAALAAMDREPIAVGEELCSDCPPVGYPTDKTRCEQCPHRHTAEQSAADRVKALEEALRNARYSLEYWERECRVAGKNPKWAVGPYERGLQEIDRTRQALEGR